MRSILAAAASALVLTACATVPAPEQAQTQTAAPVVAASSIEAHIRFLADDLLEGREAGERGYDIAAAYMESQFRLIGLEPGGMDGYRAPVPLQVMSANQDEASFVLNGESLTPGQDFVVSAHAALDEASIEADAVFTMLEGQEKPDADVHVGAGVVAFGPYEGAMDGAAVGAAVGGDEGALDGATTPRIIVKNGGCSMKCTPGPGTVSIENHPDRQEEQISEGLETHK
mgnify:CR=1 FL=1